MQGIGTNWEVVFKDCAHVCARPHLYFYGVYILCVRHKTFELKSYLCELLPDTDYVTVVCEEISVTKSQSISVKELKPEGMVTVKPVPRLSCWVTV